MKRRGRKAFMFLLLLAALAGGYWLWPHEPTYQGRKLSAWLQDLVELEQHRPPLQRLESCRAWELRRQKPVAAVRNIGPKALPCLLSWLRAAPNPASSAHKVKEWVNGTLHIPLPEKADRSELAIEGFDVLGPSAAPAVPELTRMLLAPRHYYQGMASLSCLYSIGQPALPALARSTTNSDSVLQRETMQVLQALVPQVGATLIPVFVNAVTNHACIFQADALMGLGDIGPAAAGISPWLESIARDSTNALAGPAMRVLAEVSERPERYLGLWRQRLTETNSSADAAFALARVGLPGIPPLLEALTNQNRIIKNAAIVALNPGFRETVRGTAMKDVGLRFSNLSASFERRVMWRNSSACRLAADAEAQSLSVCLGQLLDHPDAATRRHLVQRLAGLGRYGAPRLCRAAVDADETVSEAANAALAGLDVEVAEGAIVRGPKHKKQIALIFTGHEYAEGRYVIAEELARHNAQASFFLTENFLASPEFRSFIERIYREGHYLGPHSDKHLVYCSGDEPKRTLVTHAEFQRDLSHNWDIIGQIGQTGLLPGYFVPPSEHYNLEIVEWAANAEYLTINCTPGTRSPADYTREGDRNFVSSKEIFDSIVARERQDPNGLNGFILLFHIGTGPGREDKFLDRFGDLLDYLGSKGYQFVAIDELFDPEAAQVRRNAIVPRRPMDSAVLDALKKRYGLNIR